MRVHENQYIGGEWAPSHSKECVEVTNSTTEDVVARVLAGAAEDADGAVQAARGALNAWSAIPVV